MPLSYYTEDPDILLCHHFPVHITYKHEQNTHLCMPLGCTPHHILCTVVHLGRERATGMRKMFTFPQICVDQVKKLDQNVLLFYGRAYNTTSIDDSKT